MRTNRLLAVFVVTNMLLIGAVIFLCGTELARARGLFSPTVPTTPKLISYQGTLADGNGNPINGTKALTLAVYSTATGGAPLWQETHNPVTVTAGAFSVLLGANLPISDTLFDQPDRWLEIQVDGVTLAPRQRFTSVPYALNADKVDGKDASELGGASSLPSGAVVWFQSGITPTGFTPLTNTPGQDVGPWIPLPTAPLTRYVSCDVWTGSEVLCWSNSSVFTGGMRYTVASNAWSSMSTASAPVGRGGRVAVWTGSKMIVWGGISANNTGAVYNPSADSWTVMTAAGAPLISSPGAVWTGNKMMVTSGNTSTLYDLDADAWTPVTTTNAPALGSKPILLWTGSKVIAWGGYGYPEGHRTIGGLYDPLTDSWTAMAKGGPGFSWGEGYNDSLVSWRYAVWTGSEMAVLSPADSFIYFYNPNTNTWRTSLEALPESDGYYFTYIPTSYYRVPREDDYEWGAPIVVGNLLFAYSGIYDLAQNRWAANASVLTKGNRFWIGDKILNIRGDQISSHAIKLVYPYIKD